MDNQVVVSKGQINFRAFIAAVYDLSEPKGLGHLQYRPGPIPPYILDNLAEKAMHELAAGKGVILSLDYVAGRACKIELFLDADGDYCVFAPWFDHTDDDLQELVHRLSEPKHYLPGNKGAHFFSDYERPAEFRRSEPAPSDGSTPLSDFTFADPWTSNDSATSVDTSSSDSFSGGGGDFGGAGSSNDF